MPRKIKQSRSLFGPLTDNLSRRLSNADARQRRRIVRYGCWIIGLWFFWSLMVGTYSIPRIVRLELQRSSLEDMNQNLLIELIDSDRQHKMLQNDSRFIEHVARTRYHMVRPDETIYYYRGRH